MRRSTGKEVCPLMAKRDNIAELLGGLLDEAHFAVAEHMPSIVAKVASRAGWEISIYVVDFDQHVLRALSGPPHVRQEHSVEGTLAGRCFRQSEPVAVGRGAHEAWIPLIDGVERLGVLHVRLPSGDDITDPDTAREVRWVAYLIGHLIASKAAYADYLHRARMSHPRSVPSELVWSLLPPLTVACYGLAIAGGLEPSHSLAGDIFDYAIDSDVAHIAIADATGHDLDAAVIGALLLATYRATRKHGKDLRAAASEIDEVLTGYRDDTYATGVLGELDLGAGTFSYINAGHPAPLLLRGGKIVKSLDAGRRVLFGLPARTVSLGVEQLEAGDWLVFYTDGVVEARDGARQFFGLERLIDVVERCAADQQNASETLRRITHAVLRHQHHVLQDDASVVILQWNTTLEQELTAT